jgi:hypothetical protein
MRYRPPEPGAVDCAALWLILGDDGGVLDLTDYELVWPPDLFVAEARRILGRPRPSSGEFDLLLREAFRDANVAEDAASLSADHSFFGSDRPDPVRPMPDVVRELADRASEIRQYSGPRPYWPARRGRAVPESYLDSTGARQSFADLVGDLQGRGYLDQIFPTPCVDDRDALEVDVSRELEKRLGVPDLWPLRPREWDDDTFYGLVEVYHDLVSRPRTRYNHDFNQCGWHYDNFATTTGQEVYRWRVNGFLTAAGINYRLADRGEDVGRLVEIFDDGRTALITETINHSQPDATARVRHAIALFRGRAVTDEDKRSALITLAGVLEERRQLIRNEMTRADEGALFEIANRFALRHRNAQQLANYDSAFLDWIFWWYLGTVELTNRIIARKVQGI